MDFCAQEWIGREDAQGGLVGWIDIYLGFPCFGWMKTKRKRRPCGSCFEMPIKNWGVVTIIKATSPDSLRMKMNPCSKFYKSTHPSTHLPLRYPSISHRGLKLFSPNHLLQTPRSQAFAHQVERPHRPHPRR